MASTFVAVNADAGPAIAVIDTEKTTSQPTASHVEAPTQHMAVDPPGSLGESLTTPTQATFGINGMASQRPLPAALPASPMPVPDAPESHSSPQREAPRRGNSQSSEKSKESEDVDMDGSDGEETHEGNDENVGDSDNESTADANAKKKKSQKFYCTDYPPCRLSFTRSEHLARHIR
jgi:C2H2 transcription facotor